MLTVAFGESTLSQKSVYKWYKRFTEGREDVDDDEHPGGATTSTSEENIETVKKMFLKIVESLLGKLQRMLAYQSAHAIPFSRMFWV
ncbi:hypothetical protein BBW68_14925 [Candidatus Erwinia dacicola]|uniref:Mos1 transposase HTH domain-containing protein n=1 Tax=Candidatus Erwinia dacicola TaxID=252393 RepID=A0A1E7YVI9_9GAMM|nr:hypothetical protein [Candidatus Erwinia dacicola]OFC60206.1 hypothetical protein BBW68_14925 [Candidatus Erwinia dacicola]